MIIGHAKRMLDKCSRWTTSRAIDDRRGLPRRPFLAHLRGHFRRSSGSTTSSSDSPSRAGTPTETSSSKQAKAQRISPALPEPLPDDKKKSTPCGGVGGVAA
jgi:hypothetical protein